MKNPNPLLLKYYNLTMSKLQDIRKAKGYSQSMLAKEIGIGLQTIRSFEQGWRNINSTELVIILKLCNTLDCRIEDILDDEETLTEWEKYQKRVG